MIAKDFLNFLTLLVLVLLSCPGFYELFGGLKAVIQELMRSMRTCSKFEADGIFYRSSTSLRRPRGFRTASALQEARQLRDDGRNRGSNSENEGM